MNEVKVYQDPKQFWNEVSPGLRQHEATNSLLLGLSYLFQTEAANCLYQSAVFSKGQLQGALVCSRYLTNSNLLPSPIADKETAEKLFARFSTQNIPISGMVGELHAAKQYEALLHNSGRKTKVNLRQGVYRCRKVNMPVDQADVKFRLANEQDVSTIAQWMRDFHKEAIPFDPPSNWQDLASFRVGKKMIYVLEKRNQLVSMAAWNRDIETSCAVNLVFTPKDLRKTGLASLLTAKLTQLLLDNGKKETNLYTDMSNPTSNKIYQDIGYELVCDSIHIGVLKS